MVLSIEVCLSSRGIYWAYYQTNSKSAYSNQSYLFANKQADTANSTSPLDHED